MLYVAMTVAVVGITWAPFMKNTRKAIAVSVVSLITLTFCIRALGQ